MIDESLEREQLTLIHVIGMSCDRSRPGRRAEYMDCHVEIMVNKIWTES